MRNFNKKNTSFAVMLLLSLSLLAQTPNAKALYRPAVFLEEKGWLYTESDGLMQATVLMGSGTNLEVLCKEIEGSPVNTQSLYKGSQNTPAQSAVFYRIRYDGKLYWAKADSLAIEKKLSVVIEAAALYSEPSLAAVKNLHINAGIIVAAGKRIALNKKLVLTEISYFSEGSVSVAYINEKKLSSLQDDITAFKILENVRKAESAQKREALLKSALKLNVSPKVASLLKLEQGDNTY